MKIEPEWVEALSTFVVAPGTLLLVGYTVIDRRRDRLERRKQQASQVDLSEATASTAKHSGGFEINARCVLRNRSASMINHVRLEITVMYGHHDDPVILRSEDDHFFRRLQPGGEREKRQRFELEDDPGVYTLTSAAWFTDAAGHRWMRDADHDLHHLGRE